jgi:predicted nucleic acid-binding protein
VTAPVSVLDAGVLIRATLPGADREPCWGLLLDLAEEGSRLAAPTLLAYEIASSFSKFVHFGHLEPEDADAALVDCRDLDVELFHPDLEGQRAALAWSRKLGRAAAYDSFYLGLAERLGCDLWTTDLKLVHAVDLPWVRAVPGLAD